MPNKLYGIPISPFVRKVIIVLSLKKVPFESIDIRPGKQPEYYKETINPLNKIPSFQDDRVIIPDSAVICDYLEQLHPEPSIYPKDIAQRARALWFQSYADQFIAPLVGPGLFFERKVQPIRFGRQPNEEKIADSLEKLKSAWNYLESQLTGSAFVVGDTLSIADISIVTQLLHAQYAEVGIPKETYPKLEAYFTKLIQLPVFKDRIAEDSMILQNLA
jgi:glutathione S-transferase